jgi:hypothetical protein
MGAQHRTAAAVASTGMLLGKPAAQHASHVAGTTRAGHLMRLATTINVASAACLAMQPPSALSSCARAAAAGEIHQRHAVCKLRMAYLSAVSACIGGDARSMLQMFLGSCTSVCKGGAYLIEQHPSQQYVSTAPAVAQCHVFPMLIKHITQSCVFCPCFLVVFLQPCEQWPQQHRLQGMPPLRGP